MEAAGVNGRKNGKKGQGEQAMRIVGALLRAMPQLPPLFTSAQRTPQEAPKQVAQHGTAWHSMAPRTKGTAAPRKTRTKSAGRTGSTAGGRLPWG